MAAYQQLYRDPLMGGGRKNLQRCGRFALILIFLCIGGALSRRYKFAFEMGNIQFGHKTCHHLMTCSIFKCTDRERDRFTTFNVYISGPAVSQGCNVVGPKHGNISSLVSGYVVKMKTHDYF